MLGAPHKQYFAGVTVDFFNQLSWVPTSSNFAI